jgi:hypothetical protein
MLVLESGMPVIGSMFVVPFLRYFLAGVLIGSGSGSRGGPSN